ncbi:MAG: response regulator [Clostridia bacterium]|nr:response regulator [Clostridia bacterium]
MKTIVVDDEALSIRRFLRLSKDIPELNIIGKFISPEKACEFARNNDIEIAFLDIEMPVVSGIDLAKELREINPDVIIVFISAYDSYIREFNIIGGDYYIVKPLEKEVIESTMDKIRLLAQRQEKDIHIRTFGTFSVLKNGVPVPLVGKAKEILAYVVTFRGKEVSNQAIYAAVWEGRPYGDKEINVFYNAIRRLRNTLKKEGIEDILVSTKRGQFVNTKLFDCDYYSWLDNNSGSRDRFEGEFLTEYSWAEEKLAELIFSR